jgi:hypothetical protein
MKLFQHKNKPLQNIPKKILKCGQHPAIKKNKRARNEEQNHGCIIHNNNNNNNNNNTSNNAIVHGSSNISKLQSPR